MDEQIKLKAEYCLNCTAKPCKSKGCPLSNDIPTFIKLVKENKIKEAYNVLLDTTILGSVCGRICPHEKQCMGSCIRGIKAEPVQIGYLESFVFDQAIKNEYYKDIKKDDSLQGKRVAIIGGGPAGLNASFFLLRKGANVTIYEKHRELGGILSHGIPEFRLEKDILDKTLIQLTWLGVNVEYGKELGKNLSLTKLKENYDAIFLAVGANIPGKMNIPGENLIGVYGGNFILENKNHPNYNGKIVAVIGGGNVAMDTARTAKRKCAKRVYVIYRRAEEQMPAEKKEIKKAKEEGIEFLFQNNILKILSKQNENTVEKIECVKTKLVKKENEDRLSPVDIENSNYFIDVDFVIMAIGSVPEKEMIDSLNLELTKNGYIKVNENYQTSIDKIFAGGDIIETKKTVAWAAKNGREAANAIEKYLNK